jgi:hypothetical protein
LLHSDLKVNGGRGGGSFHSGLRREATLTLPEHSSSWAEYQAVYQYYLPSLSQGTETSVHIGAEVQCE